MWEDNTVDYFTSFRKDHLRRPICARFSYNMALVHMLQCAKSFAFKSYLCQIPIDTTSRIPHHQMAPKGFHTRSGGDVYAHLASPENSTVVQFPDHFPRSSRVVCPGGHFTHVFLACDAQSACWGDEYVIYSLSSDAWAVPTSSSCPAPMSSLPPSFACEWGEQRVPYSVLCDHRADCRDASDEDFCHFPPCHVDRQFQCNNKEVWISVQ